jgi:hypothetical protein
MHLAGHVNRMLVALTPRQLLDLKSTSHLHSGSRTKAM